MKVNNLDEIRQYLNAVAFTIKTESVDESDEIKKVLKAIKDEYVINGNQDKAKLVWIYERILNIQQNYIKAFRLLKAKKYYDAWCLFERVEIELSHLKPHFSISDDAFSLEFIDKQTDKFQSLYPYKYFMSPGYLILEAKCSICNQKRSIRNSCGHILGEIYNGEMCGREITKAEMLELSLVKNPSQKYSVPFAKDAKTGEQVDNYDYTLVQYVTDGLRNPFDEWDCEWTQIRHPHSQYLNISGKEQCPCESGEKYEECCLKERGIIRPHLEIVFSKPPPEDFPPIVYTR